MCAGFGHHNECLAGMMKSLVAVGFLLALTAYGQLSVNIRPESVLNTPGTFSTFEIDYRWASTTQELAGAKIEIPLPDPIDNDAAGDVVIGLTAHVQSTSLSAKKVTYTFKNPLPAGASGTLTLQTRYRADGTITNGVTRPIEATFSATGKPSVSDTSFLTSVGCLPPSVTLSKSRTTGGSTNDILRYTIQAQVPQTLSLDVDPFVLVDRLPVGAVFVAAGSSGVYDSSSHTVIWPARRLEAGATAVSYTLDVTYPSSSGFVVGSSVTNIAVSTNTPLYSSTIIRAATNVYTLVAPTISFDQTSKADAGFNGLFGDSFTWEVEARNRATVMADTLTVEDSIPPALVPTAFNPGYANYGTTVVWMYYRTMLSPTWNLVTGSPVSTISATDANSKLVNVSTFGLVPGDVVTGYRWVYTNFSALATLRSVTGPTVTGYIAETDRDGQTVAPDAIITNNATVTMTRAGSTPVTANVSDTIQLAQPRANVDLTKALNPTGQVGYPGTTNTWRLTVQNTSSATTNLFNPVIADLIPASLDYVAGSAVRGGVGFTNAVITATPNYKGSGRTHLRVAFLGALGVSQSATVDFSTVVRGNTLGSTVQNTFSFLGSDNTGTVFADSAVSDTNDLDNDGNTSETFPTASANLTVNTTAAVNSRKHIQGYPDLSFQPLESASYLGGPMAYRLRIQNIGNVAFTNVTIVDMLPHPGDTGVIVTNELRGSVWTPFLTGPVSAPAGVSVAYSQSDNPWRPELLEGGPPDAVNDWSPVPPDDIRTVKSLRFSFGDTVLAPADTFELTWPMQVPLGAPTNTYAVNSFGFVATRQDTGESLLPSEPLSVRIKANPPAPVNIGDYVWNDANTNGVQDAGETGLDNVRVELYRDGGDGVAGSADDTLVTYVMTGVDTNGASGFYQFSNEPPGNYFVRVVPPVGYSFSPADQGSDDAADSDVAPASGYTALLVTHSGDQIWTVDAGLFFTGYGTVGNYVWNDRNGDGVQNESPADGLNGVRVELHAVEGGLTNLVDTRATGYDSFGNPGYYRFDYVNPGDYVLRFVAPSNFTFTTRGPMGSADATDSDPEASTGFTESFTVSLGENDLSWDAGLRPPSGSLSLGNIVWYDSDGDRVYDRFAGEYGINGVPLSLYRDVNGDGVSTEGVDPLYGSTVTATLGGEDGRYLFSGLPAGDYIVVVDATAFVSGEALYGLLSTPGQQTADNDVDHDDDGAPDGNGRVVSTRLTLSAGDEPAYGIETGEDTSTDSNLTLDFGFLYATNLVGVGGTLFLDANNDGLQGAGEAVFSDHAVQLWSPGANGLKGGGDDAFVVSALTGGNGAYLFDDLPPGRYFVVIPSPPESARSATVLAVDADNGQDADSNALQPGGLGAAVFSPVFLLEPHAEPAGASESGPGGSADDALACGESNVDLTQDFGFADLAPVWAIRGQVRDDYDLDGNLDDPDMPLGGVTIQLFSDPNGDGNPADGAQLRSTSTLADGTYAFTELPNGRYVVVESNPAGAASTADAQGANDDRIAVTVNNADRDGNDFLDAFHPQGYFYHVLDGSIVPGGGVSVTGPGTVSLLMDGSSGQYSFVIDGTPGTYTLALTPPPGFLIDPSRPPVAEAFDPAGGPDPTWLGSAESMITQGYLTNFTAEANTYYVAFVLGPDRPLVLNNNIPLMRPNRLGNWVWEDMDGDGIQDAGEMGISNVVVRLLDVELNVITSVVTDAGGYYFFDNPGTAERRVQVVPPSNYLFTLNDAETVADSADSDVSPADGRSAPIGVASGATNLTLDAGLYVPAVVRGYVFRDANGDLLRNAGDVHLTNVLVRLIEGGEAFASVTNDATGYFEFVGVPAGTVSVLVSRAGGTLSGVPSQEPGASDETRNRALPDAPGVDAYIAHSVVSGQGVLAGRPAETLNFGFVTKPLSTALDLDVYASGGGVMIDVWAVNEAGYEDIVIYAWIGNAWTEVGRVPSWQIVGEGSNRYTVQASGLAVDGAYFFKVVDEAGHVHFSDGPVAVHAIRVAAVRLDMQTLVLTFNTEKGRKYRVMASTDLVNWATEYASFPTARGWSAYSDEPFTAGGASVQIRVPVNGRRQAFFKVVRADE